MRESHKKTVLTFELVTAALDTFEQDMLDKIVALESSEKSLQNELVAAAARLESSERSLQNELAAAALRDQSVQQRIAAIEATIKSRSPSHKPMSELRCASNLKNLGSDKSRIQKLE